MTHAKWEGGTGSAPTEHRLTGVSELAINDIENSLDIALGAGPNLDELKRAQLARPRVSSRRGIIKGYAGTQRANYFKAHDPWALT